MADRRDPVQGGNAMSWIHRPLCWFRGHWKIRRYLQVNVAELKGAASPVLNPMGLPEDTLEPGVQKVAGLQPTMWARFCGRCGKPLGFGSRRYYAPPPEIRKALSPRVRQNGKGGHS